MSLRNIEFIQKIDTELEACGYIPGIQEILYL